MAVDAIRDAVRRLDDDATKLLVAGAHLAAGDPDLERDGERLAALAKQLGAKAPVIGQLAGAVARARAATGSDAARELVSVATSVKQVRAAQAALAPAEGEAVPMPAAEPLGTPCNARALYELRDALVKPGQGRMPVIEKAIESGDVADLRLLDAVVLALGDPYLGEKIAAEALPLLGKAVAGPLRRRFDPKGGAHDARRLRALVAIEKAAAVDLIRAGLREGKPELRTACLEAMAVHAPGLPEFEPFILELIAKERALGPRQAAVGALAGYSSDASLEALMKELDEAGSQTRRHAARALGTSKHPDVVERLLASLEAALEAPPAPAKKKGAPKKKPARAAPKKGAAAERKARVGATLDALAPHADARIARRAVALLDEFPEPAARAIIASGTKKDLATVADLIDGADEALYDVAIEAALALGPDQAFARLSKVVKAKAPGRRLRHVCERLAEGASPKWRELLLDVAAKQEPALGRLAVAALARTKDRGALPGLRALFEEHRSRSSELRTGIVLALGELGDKEALEVLLEGLEAPSSDHRFEWALRRAIFPLADETHVDRIRTILAKKTARTDARWKHSALRSLLEALEQKYPGS